MCVVSMVTDHYYDKWKIGIPNLQQPFLLNVPLPNAAEIKEFRDLLIKAREYDRRNNEPDCELQEKKDRLKKLAKDLGFNIDFIDGKEVV